MHSAIGIQCTQGSVDVWGTGGEWFAHEDAGRPSLPRLTLTRILTLTLTFTQVANRQFMRTLEDPQFHEYCQFCQKSGKVTLPMAFTRLQREPNREP